MRFMGLLIALAVVGYSIYMYLGTSSVSIVSTDGAQTKPAEYIDHASKSADALTQTLQQHKDRLDKSN